MWPEFGGVQGVLGGVASVEWGSVLCRPCRVGKVEFVGFAEVRTKCALHGQLQAEERAVRKKDIKKKTFFCRLFQIIIVFRWISNKN